MRIDSGLRHDDAALGVGRELVPVEAPTPPARVGAADAVEDVAPARAADGSARRADIRALSPRQMAEYSLDLYVDGAIGFDDYAMLAFQPELHPDYNQTIGALTGEEAAPDRPRDFVKLWEERLEFELRHNPQNSPRVTRTERVVGLLRQIDRPTDVSV